MVIYTLAYIWDNDLATVYIYIYIYCHVAKYATLALTVCLYLCVYIKYEPSYHNHEIYYYRGQASTPKHGGAVRNTVRPDQ